MTNNKKELITYWVNSSDNDFKAMIHLFEKGDYTWSLFIGHLVLEKLIKAWYIKNTSELPPLIHDLVRLCEKGRLPLNDAQKDNLDTISAFNLKARYDDYKMEFHKKCSEEFTAKWINIIKESRIWVKKILRK
ncbi:MAG: HEPN domain-containing protein [Desulfobacterales bacterium]